MGKCNLCGKKALEIVEVCPECLQRAEVPPEEVNRLKRVNDILQITSNGESSIKKCIESILDIAQELERSGISGKKE